MIYDLNTTKDQLIELFVNDKLFGFLMKKGDLICYGKMLGISLEDLRVYFEQHGYPGLNVPRNPRRTTPEGGEGDTVWIMKDGVYTVWYIERNTPVQEFSTDSKPTFEAWWKEHITGV